MNWNATGASTLAAMQADLVKTAFLPPAGGATAIIICKWYLYDNRSNKCRSTIKCIIKEDLLIKGW